MSRISLPSDITDVSDVSCFHLPLRLNAIWLSLCASTQPNHPRWFIFARDGYRCIYCQRELTEYGDTAATIDHVIPQCALPSHAIANQDINRVACCRRCNQLKRHWVPTTPTHRAWYDRAYCLKVIASRLRLKT